MRARIIIVCAALFAELFAAFIASCLVPRPSMAQQGTGPIPNSTNAGVYGATVNSNGGHVSFGGGAPPAINVACGTGPVAPVGTDSAFQFTSGTTSNNGCAVTFATPWNNIPTCNVDSQLGATPAYTVTRTGILITGVADISKYHVSCIGQPGG